MDAREILRNLYELVKTIALVVVLSFSIRAFLIQTFVVQGKSMEPNFGHGDYLLVDKLTYRFTDPRRGQVVVFRNPENRRVDFVKRIIGLPNEQLEIRGSQVLINGTPLVEGYLDKVQDPDSSEALKVQLDPNQYFLMGDNRTNSLDSRRIGPIVGRDILGRVFVRVLPVSRTDFINQPSYPGI